jgi:predicted transcriptional regulator
MNSFYSILYCPIRPIVDERLSIALILRAKDKIYFRYSLDKLKIIKDLLPASAFNLLRSSLKNIESYISNKEQVSSGELLFPDQDHVIPERFFQFEYFQYLSDYSNNLLNFSTPKSLNIAVNDVLFNNLYQKLIFENDSVIDKKEQIDARVKHKVNPKIKSRVNLDIELTSKDVSDLIVPTHVWFIGKNGHDVTGEILDFDKQTHHLENDIREHFYLLNSLRNKNKNYSGKHFIVGKEPQKTNITKHSIWNELRNLSYLTYINPSETGQITEYVESHGVKPFVEDPLI